MSNVFRKQKVPFTQIPNSLLNSSAISLKSKGLWAYMNAKPDDWQFSATRIAEEVKEDRKTILSALKELVSNGYLIANKLSDGRMEYILMWNPRENKNYEQVCSKKEPTKNEKSVVKNTTNVRPMRKDFQSDEEFEKAFYAWNSSPKAV